ncbi:class I SAM-dependent methyltransferase [Lutispora sp.]|uniref:class I SAM-dependent methyltransferase n=1 Tax=Lutispora sp. TaxID=2828727 RepID=UPI002B214A43|nr:class I SAM-dependent methyltransferase [Lutispora sp.]MEA4963752.1 class I SAM-dependent methyltransferase [Lutispora sp.]
MQVNYNNISKNYDDVRNADLELINMFLEMTIINENTKVLDFGCGTGNYADKLQRITGARVYGVEPSEGMREKARQKNASLSVVEGNHENIPFEEKFFDFIYMTDVIHHVPDINRMFEEINRVLVDKGKLCICTQSHKQIENRFYVKYFPSTAIVDKKRYPDVDLIKTAGEKNGLRYLKNIIMGEGDIINVGMDFVDLVRNKGYSMFHLIPEEEYEKGLSKLEEDMDRGGLAVKISGDSLVWFIKEKK